MTRRQHRRVVAPTTRLGASAEGDLTPPGVTRARPKQVRRQAEAAPSSSSAPPAPGPVVPTRASEDTDEAWGERPEGSDDARFLRDRPPHWQ